MGHELTKGGVVLESVSIISVEAAAADEFNKRFLILVSSTGIMWKQTAFTKGKKGKLISYDILPHSYKKGYC